MELVLWPVWGVVMLNTAFILRIGSMEHNDLFACSQVKGVDKFVKFIYFYSYNIYIRVKS